jgi:hypothetical protein
VAAAGVSRRLLPRKKSFELPVDIGAQSSGVIQILSTPSIGERDVVNPEDVDRTVRASELELPGVHRRAPGRIIVGHDPNAGTGQLLERLRVDAFHSRSKQSNGKAVRSKLEGPVIRRDQIAGTFHQKKMLETSRQIAGQLQSDGPRFVGASKCVDLSSPRKARAVHPTSFRTTPRMIHYHPTTLSAHRSESQNPRLLHGCHSPEINPTQRRDRLQVLSASWSKVIGKDHLRVSRQSTSYPGGLPCRNPNT